MRGFGTAIMHGGATAIFGVVSVALARGDPTAPVTAFLPGLLAAVVAAFGLQSPAVRNPALATLGILLALPPLISSYSSAASKRCATGSMRISIRTSSCWNSINSDDFSQSHVGAYLQSLREKFRGEVVADMLCYMRLHVELALRAKGVLLMRESGIEDRDRRRDARASWSEIEYLEQEHRSDRSARHASAAADDGKDLWQI